MPVSRSNSRIVWDAPVLSNGHGAGQVVLSAEQHNAVEWLLSSPRPVQTLGGYAGTGKTTVIRTIKEHLPSFAVCAYTGKAANVLRRKGVENASTIHSLIFKAREEEWYDERGRVHVKVVFDLKPPGEVDCAGFIVDEASMVNRELHDALLSFGRPLIYVGDHGQLPPIGGADFNLMARPDVTLETVHRNAGEIARFAEFLRKGNRAEDWEEQDGCTGERVRLNTVAQMMEELSDMPDQIICAYNTTRVGINRDARDHYSYPPDRPVKGDRVMCLQNERRLGLFNGMQGTIKALAGDEMVFTADGKDYRVRFDLDRFNLEKTPEGYQRRGRVPFDYCYAVTCHKAQGDEWDHVLVLEQCCRQWEHARWAYTAASRAREQLRWVVL